MGDEIDAVLIDSLYAEKPQQDAVSPDSRNKSNTAFKPTSPAKPKPVDPSTISTVSWSVDLGSTIETGLIDGLNKHWHTGKM